MPPAASHGALAARTAAGVRRMSYRSVEPLAAAQLPLKLPRLMRKFPHPMQNLPSSRSIPTYPSLSLSHLLSLSRSLHLKLFHLLRRVLLAAEGLTVLVDTHAGLKSGRVSFVSCQRLPKVFRHVHNMFRLAEGQLIIVEGELAFT